MPFSDYANRGAGPIVPIGFCGDIRTSSVSVGSSSAVRLGTPGSTRRSVIVYNKSSVTVYLGGSDVTTASGLPLPASTSFSADLASADLYAIAESGTGNDIRVWEVS